MGPAGEEMVASRRRRKPASDSHTTRARTPSPSLSLSLSPSLSPSASASLSLSLPPDAQAALTTLRATREVNRVLFVCPTGKADARCLAAALAAARTGTAILLAPGDYHERTPLAFSASLSLSSASALGPPSASSPRVSPVPHQSGGETRATSSSETSPLSTLVSSGVGPPFWGGLLHLMTWHLSMRRGWV